MWIWDVVSMCEMMEDKHPLLNFCIESEFCVSEGKKFTSDSV